MNPLKPLWIRHCNNNNNNNNNDDNDNNNNNNNKCFNWTSAYLFSSVVVLLSVWSNFHIMGCSKLFCLLNMANQCSFDI